MMTVAVARAIPVANVPNLRDIHHVPSAARALPAFRRERMSAVSIGAGTVRGTQGFSLYQRTFG
jgi:hypothetical protein